QIFQQQRFSNWFHSGQAPAPFFFQNTNLFRSYQRFVDTVTGIIKTPGVVTGCCDWTPWNGDYSGTSPASDGLGINPQSQQTWAGYGMVHFKHGRMDGNVGVRLVSTDSSGTGLFKFDSNGLGPGAPQADLDFSNGAAV